MKRKWRIAVALAVALFLTWNYVPLPGDNDLTISPETTYISGPLLPDGAPDYVGYLNAKYSEGVTPANNATVAIIQVLGPDLLVSRSPYYRAACYEALGVAALSEEGDYFTRPSESILDCEEVGRLIQTPRRWQDDEFPDLARWVEAQARHLDAAAQAVQRPRWYLPLATREPEGIFTDSLAYRLRLLVSLADALCLRSMARLQLGQVEDAWDDAMAAARLSRLMSQSPFVLYHAISNCMHRKADRCLVQIAFGKDISAERLRAMRADFLRLPPSHSVVKAIDAEGFIAFEAARVAREGLQFEQRDLRGSFDWNEIFRTLCRWHHERLAVYERATFAERRAAREAWQAGWEVRCAALEPSNLDMWLAMFAGRLGRPYANQIMLAMLNGFAPDLFWQHYVQATEALQRDDLISLGLAVAVYRAETGKYPETLAELMPELVDELPLDRFSGRPLVYRRMEEGYLLYSVGPNLRDDRGAWRQDGDTVDDIAIGVPLPSLETEEYPMKR